LAGVAGFSEIAGLLAQRLDRLNRAVGVGPGLGVEGDDIGPGGGEGLQIGVDRRDHQVNVERLGGVRAQGLHHHRADRDVGDEVAVHHVDMDPVGPGGVNRAHFLAQAGKIGGEDRRRNQRHRHGRQSRQQGLA
jgi:hypothetical protein